MTNRSNAIKYLAAPHRYVVNGKEERLTATSLASAMWDEVSTAKLIGGMRSRGTLAQSYPGKTSRDIARAWSEQAARACELGTKLHAAIHKAISGQTDWVTDEAEISIELDMARRFYLEQIQAKGLEVYCTEMPIFYDNPTSDIVIPGCVDCVLFDPATDEYIIIDWKRSQKLERVNGVSEVTGLADTKLNRFSLQVSTYAYILSRCYGLNVATNRMYIVVLHAENPGGTYQMLKAADLTELVDTELVGRYDFYRARNEKNLKIKAQNKRMLR